MKTKQSTESKSSELSELEMTNERFETVKSANYKWEKCSFAIQLKRWAYKKKIIEIKKKE